MTNNIVDLDALVPDDLEFKYRGKSYLVPGDIPTETVFRFTKLYRDLSEVETADDQDVDQLEKMLAVVEREVLAVLQIRDPELEKCPFGALGLSAALLQILSLLGVVETIPLLESQTEDPPKGRTTKNSSQRKRKSPSSKGSRR